MKQACLCSIAGWRWRNLRPARARRRAGFAYSEPSDLVAESRDCRSEMCLCGIPELGHQGMSLECLLHDAALNAFAATVNQADLTQARRVRGSNVLLDDRCHVPWRERVQVELIVDGNAVRHRFTSRWTYVGDGYDAVTIVLIPPRTEKSPTTVMRRGAHAATRSSRIWFVTAS